MENKRSFCNFYTDENHWLREIVTVFLSEIISSGNVFYAGNPCGLPCSLSAKVL
jgi:hypothetical protein